MSFIILIFYVICLYIRPQEIQGLFFRSNIMFYLGISLVVFWILGIIKGNYKIAQVPQNIFIVCLLLAIALSQLTNLYFHGAYKGFYEFSINVILYFIISSVLDSEKKVIIFIWILILCSSYIACEGVLLYYNRAGIDNLTMDEGRIRYVSIFGDPNDMALAINTILPFLFYFIFYHTSKLFKFISMLLLVICIYAIWLTNSRGGILTFCFITTMFTIKRYKYTYGVVLSIIILLIMLAYAPTRMSMLTFQEESARGRIVGMRTGMELMRSNYKSIFLGNGYGSFAEGPTGYVAHNSPMHVAGETGILGLYFWMGLIYISIKGLSAQFKNKIISNKNTYDLSHVLLISLIGFLFGALFLSSPYNPILYMLYGCIASILIIRRNIGEMINTYPTANEYIKNGIITAAILVIVNIFIRVVS